MKKMAKHYLLYGHGGSFNHGSEASVRCDIALLRKYFPDCRITLVSHFPEQDRRFGLDADEIVGRDPAGRTNEEVYAAAIERITPETVCLSVGGDMYCYPNWQRYAAIHYEALKRGARSILWSCSVEPSMLDNEMMRAFGSHHLVTVREGKSFQALQDRGLTNVVQVADIAFTLSPMPAAIGVEGDYVALNLSPLILRRSPGVLAAYQALIGKILEETQWSIVLVPHVLAAADNDCEALAALLRDDPRVWMAPESLVAAELKYILSKSRFCVASRTHACIAAYSSGVPTLAIGYSLKAFGIAEDLGQTDFVLDAAMLDASELLARFERLVGRETEIRSCLTRLIPVQCGRTAPPEVVEALL